MNKTPRPFLILTNDDGYTSPGLRALWRALADDYDLLVIAPDRQRSWIAKAITNPGPLELIQETVDGRAVQVLRGGTPADCANVGIYHLSPRKPDLLLSGINLGPNYTHSLTISSGTVGAALEAACNGVKAISIGYDLDLERLNALEEGSQAQVDFFSEAADVVKNIVHSLMITPLPDGVGLINVVIPQTIQQPPKIVQCDPMPYEHGSVFLRQGNQFRNRSVGFLAEGTEIVPGSDVWAVRQGWVAFTAYTGRLETANQIRIEISL